MVRQGVKALLEREGFIVVGEAGNGYDALEMAGALQPDVAVLDLDMPIMNGTATAREIQNHWPKIKSIILGMQTESRSILEGLRAGAKGYVTKTNAAADLTRAIREAAHGGMYLSPEIAEAVIRAYHNKTDIPAEPLSARERQVLQLIVEGNSTREVASVLGISIKTGETYRTRIMEKLNLHMTADLVRYAIRRGMVEP